MYRYMRNVFLFSFSLLRFVILLVRSFFTCLLALDMFVALHLCDVMCSNLFFSFSWVSVCLFCAVWFPSPVINFVSALLLIAPIPRGRSCSPFLVCQFVIVNRICCRRRRRSRSLIGIESESIYLFTLIHDI